MMMMVMIIMMSVGISRNSMPRDPELWRNLVRGRNYKLSSVMEA